MYFLALDGTLKAASISVTGSSLVAGEPVDLFRPRLPGVSTATEQYAPHPDGTRFVVLDIVGGLVADYPSSYLLEGRLSAPSAAFSSAILSTSWTNTLRRGGPQPLPLPPPIGIHAWPVRGEIDGPELSADASSWQPVSISAAPSAGSLPLSEAALRER